MIRLNIGCGRDYRAGWMNIDISREVQAEHYLDIRKDTLPFADNSVADVYISGVLEQIGSNDEFIHALNEIHRVLKFGEAVTLVVPNARYAIAHRDPMDIRKFTPETFAYFLEGSQEYRDYGSVYGFSGWLSIEYSENARHILTVRMKK